MKLEQAKGGEKHSLVNFSISSFNYTFENPPGKTELGHLLSRSI